MKKFLMLLCAVMLVFGMVGVASAISYYEAYNGYQSISQSSRNYWFAFDIDLANNGATNSSLDFTDDAIGFDYLNGEQLDSVQIALDLYSTDSEPELFDMDVDIYWSSADFTQTVSFNARSNNGGVYHYTYNFNQAQIDGWEEGGWGTVLIDAYNISGGGNYNDFGIGSVALTAESTAPVPEPATILLMGIGLLGMVGIGRKRFNKKG